MLSEPLISIVIPVYKVELYIEKCIKSVLAQTHKNFEAIIVDDGSPDNSIEIAKQVISNDPRFIFIHKTNGGVPSARNAGIDLATGDYLVFLDSDDYLDENYLSAMYKHISYTGSDICTCNINVIANDDIIYTIENDAEKYRRENDFLLCMNSISSFAWDKMYKRNLFESMRFNEKIKTYEDSYFIFRLIYKRNISSLNRCLYNYVQRDGAITQTINDSYFVNKLAVVENYIDFFYSNKVQKKDENYLMYCYLSSYVFACSIDIAKHSPNPKKDLDLLLSNVDKKFFNRKSIFKFFLKNKKQGVYVSVLLLSKDLFLKLLNIKNKII